jgi:hypothetical protein
MGWRWLRSRWLWLVVCVAVGSLIVTIPSLQALRDLMAVADALSSGIREGLSHGGGNPREEPRRVSVSFLFGLFEIKDTPHPYLWTVISGVVTGGGLGAIAWGLCQLGVWVWRRTTRRAVERPAEPDSLPSGDGS